MGKVHNFLVLGVLAMAFISISGSASALYTDQRNVVLNLEQGQTAWFYLYMEGAGSADISHSGDINGWVSHQDEVDSGEWLEVRVEVPDDADVKTYVESIKADDEVISKLTVIVSESVSGKLNTIQSKVNEIEDDQDELIDDQDDIRTEVHDNKNRLETIEAAVSNMETDVEDIMSCVKDNTNAENQLSEQIDRLESEVSQLESEKQALESENSDLNELTGMATVNSSGIGFILGAVIGIIIASLYFRGLPGGGIGSFSRTSDSSRISSAAPEKDLEPVVEETPAKKAGHDRIRGFNEFKYDYRKK